MPDHGHIFALYRPGTAVPPILERLRSHGIGDEAVEIMSAVPLSEETSSEEASARWGSVPLYLITFVAGLIGIGVGILFAAGTAALYPLQTGGKPIVSRPVVGIIAYECMMLMAIVMTFVTTAARMVGIRRTIPHYDTRIDDGYIGILVRAEGSDCVQQHIRTLLHGDDLVELRTAA